MTARQFLQTIYPNERPVRIAAGIIRQLETGKHSHTCPCGFSFQHDNTCPAAKTEQLYEEVHTCRQCGRQVFEKDVLLAAAAEDNTALLAGRIRADRAAEITAELRQAGMGVVTEFLATASTAEKAEFQSLLVR